MTNNTLYGGLSHTIGDDQREGYITDNRLIRAWHTRAMQAEVVIGFSLLGFAFSVKDRRIRAGVIATASVALFDAAVNAFQLDINRAQEENMQAEIDWDKRHAPRPEFDPTSI